MENKNSKKEEKNLIRKLKNEIVVIKGIRRKPKRKLEELEFIRWHCAVAVDSTMEVSFIPSVLSLFRGSFLLCFSHSRSSAWERGT